MEDISGYDRIQAFIRLCDKGLIKEMAVKSGYINSLPELYGMKTLKESGDGHTFVRLGTVDNIKEFYNRLFQGAATIIPSWEQIETYAVSDKEKMNPKSLIREEKYLVVGVDLSKKKKDILAEFKSLLDISSKKVITKTQFFDEVRGKGKNFRYPKWHVYDLCSRGRKPNFTKVSRILSGETGQARDNDELARVLKVVKRAYKQTCQIMKTVEGEIRREVDV